MTHNQFLTLMKSCNAQKAISKSDYLNEIIDNKMLQYVHKKIEEVKNKIKLEYLKEKNLK